MTKFFHFKFSRLKKLKTTTPKNENKIFTHLLYSRQHKFHALGPRELPLSVIVRLSVLRARYRYLVSGSGRVLVRRRRTAGNRARYEVRNVRIEAITAIETGMHRGTGNYRSLCNNRPVIRRELSQSGRERRRRLRHGRTGHYGTGFRYRYRFQIRYLLDVRSASCYGALGRASRVMRWALVSARVSHRGGDVVSFHAGFDFHD